ncbi:flagellar hook protein FlgE [Candidatus Liberibacter brunswickensis]|uniref:flagellar hook protein FlgE n=1 Tax=Candidatus Liberibacter brunswickensis TaxID=1968796 RepID=UPI002FE2395F
MTILGSMKTAISGMDAQSNRVSAVSDNIANVNTIGYKRTAVSFSTLVFPSTSNSHVSGGIEVHENDMISAQGSLINTASNTDLAIQGQGFFIVKGRDNTNCLTRSGDFHINNEGFLENTAGGILLGYSLEDDDNPPVVVNSFEGLEKINVKNFEINANPTTSGLISNNLDKDADIVDSNKSPKHNNKDSEYTHKSSFSAYDMLGSPVIYDLYYTKIGDKKWEVSVFRQDQSTNNSFPYKNGSLEAVDISFDPTNGRLDNLSPKKIYFTDNTSGVDQDITIDISKTTQLAGGFIPQRYTIDGYAAGKPKDFNVSKDGYVDVIYDDGTRVPVYRLALATVPSQDNLKIFDGNTYLPTGDSGEISIGLPGSHQYGEIFSGALETANVDIANELTELIEAQRNYAVNSKVFQTGSDFMDILISLKR